MANNMELVTSLFRSNHWDFQWDKERRTLYSRLQGELGTWQFQAFISEKEYVLFLLATFPQKCPAKRRAACVELLNRLNFGMSLVTAEMDFDSGIIYFKTTYPLSGVPLQKEFLESMVVFNLACADKFLPAIMSVLYANLSPAKAIEVTGLTRTKLKRPGKHAKSRPDFVRRRFINN